MRERSQSTVTSVEAPQVGQSDKEQAGEDLPVEAVDRNVDADEPDMVDDLASAVTPASIVEAILFVGAPQGVKLSASKIAAVLRDVSPREVKSTVQELNKVYAESKSAFRIVERSGHYQMELDSELASVQKMLFGRMRHATLSQGAIDVLAVVAYNQGANREQIDKIRGKSSGAILTQLAKRELLRVEPIAGRSRSMQYFTTDRFLQLFSLQSLDDLPQTNTVTDLEELSD